MCEFLSKSKRLDSKPLTDKREKTREMVSHEEVRLLHIQQNIYKQIKMSNDLFVYVRFNKSNRKLDVLLGQCSRLYKICIVFKKVFIVYMKYGTLLVIKLQFTNTC